MSNFNLPSLAFMETGSESGCSCPPLTCAMGLTKHHQGIPISHGIKGASISEVIDQALQPAIDVREKQILLLPQCTQSHSITACKEELGPWCWFLVG